MSDEPLDNLLSPEPEAPRGKDGKKPGLGIAVHEHCATSEETEAWERELMRPLLTIPDARSTGQYLSSMRTTLYSRFCPIR
jgi:hypothetical protein